MSTSAPTGDKVAEPNLTPLLDMVLQLVMFFMLCANFIMEQSSKSITLPEALSARGLDKTTQSYIIVNVESKESLAAARATKDGKDKKVIQIGNEGFDTSGQTAGFFRNQRDADKGRAKPADWEAGRGRSVVIIRADKNCTYKQVDDMMAVCRQAEFQDVRLRTLKK